MIKTGITYFLFFLKTLYVVFELFSSFGIKVASMVVGCGGWLQWVSEVEGGWCWLAMMVAGGSSVVGLQ